MADETQADPLQRRPGRPKGSKNRPKLVALPHADANPLDVMRSAMVTLMAQGDVKAAAAIAAKLAPYFSSAFSKVPSPAAPHPGQLQLFDAAPPPPPPPPPLGKKAEAERAAQSAGEGTGWAQALADLSDFRGSAN